MTKEIEEDKITEDHLEVSYWRGYQQAQEEIKRKFERYFYTNNKFDLVDLHKILFQKEENKEKK